MKTRYLMLLLVVSAWLTGFAQVTSTPSPLQEDATDVTIYFHADQGNKGLMNQPSTAQIYAHTGVLTSESKSNTDWKYAPNWGDNSPKYKLEFVSQNLWKLYIGDIRTYYGVTNPNEQIKKLAFVFRTADKSKEGKGEGNSDIFLDVVDAGLQISLSANPMSEIITAGNTNVSFTVGSTLACDLEIFVNGKSVAKQANTKTLSATCDFSATNDYEVKAVATKGNETAETTGYFCNPPASKQGAYPGGTPIMGTVRDTSGKVTFCLAAPQKTNVLLVGSWNDYKITGSQVMKYTDVNGFRYFWTTIESLDADKPYPYYYIVDSTIKVGDPYAKLVLDSYDNYIPESVFPNLPAYPIDKVSGVPLAVYQENINDYNWKIKDFKGADPKDLMIYELLIRDFTGAEGKADGSGTINAACSKLYYLKHLGVNAIELLPINEFNGNISWGYNPNFYFAPDKAYGTPAAYKNFIDFCHELGIAVIIDVVLNQSDWLHPWYQMYPVGSNPFYNASAPHAYSVLNDWNQGYPLVMQQWKDMLQYWLKEYKVDGFRFDLVKGLGDNDSYSNPGDAATNAFNQSRVNRMRELQKYVLEINPNAYFINENLAGAQEENMMAETGQLNWLNLNNAGCQFAMGYQSDSGLKDMFAPNAGRTFGSTVSYLESHDEQRLAYKQEEYGAYLVKNDKDVAVQRLGCAAAQMIMSPGAHMIWMFSELGNAQNNKDQNGGNNTDPKIVNWDLLKDPAHKGLYESYSSMIAVRTKNPELFTQEATFNMACATSDWSNGRTLVSKAGDKEVITAINPNLSGSLTFKYTFAQKDNSKYEILSETYNSASTFDTNAGTITVPANSYVVIATKGVVATEKIADEEETLSANWNAGTMTISGSGSRYSVFTPSGAVVASGQLYGKATVNLPSGIYIITDGNKTVKVACR